MSSDGVSGNFQAPLSRLPEIFIFRLTRHTEVNIMRQGRNFKEGFSQDLLDGFRVRKIIDRPAVQIFQTLLPCLVEIFIFHLTRHTEVNIMRQGRN